MSQKILLETDATEALSYKMRATADAFYDYAASIYARVAWTSWDGDSKDEYLYQLQQCTSAIKQLSDHLDLLGFQLSQEVEQWVMTATKFGK